VNIIIITIIIIININHHHHHHHYLYQSPSSLLLSSLLSPSSSPSSSLSSSSQCDPNIADSWKRRGQTRVATGLIKEGLKDLTKAMTLSSDPDIKYQRGLVYYQLKNYKKSLNDFNSALASGEFTQKSALYNYIGMCEGQLGNMSLSIYNHKEALVLDPGFKEAKINYAQMYRDFGDATAANIAFLEVYICMYVYMYKYIY
jgi:tetratricopeptide (TPR) repeat protein